jgi:hypothetical protein
VNGKTDVITSGGKSKEQNILEYKWDNTLNVQLNSKDDE